MVGILLAALYNPIFTTAITSVSDFALAVGLIIVLIVLKRPPWNIVLIAAFGGLVLGILWNELNLLRNKTVASSLN